MKLVSLASFSYKLWLIIQLRNALFCIFSSFSCYTLCFNRVFALLLHVSFILWFSAMALYLAATRALIEFVGICISFASVDLSWSSTQKCDSHFIAFPCSTAFLFLCNLLQNRAKSIIRRIPSRLCREFLSRFFFIVKQSLHVYGVVA